MGFCVNLWISFFFVRMTTLPGKSWNLVRPFSRPGKSWKTAKVMESHGKWWWCPGFFFVKMHIIPCLPFTFPGVSVHSLISQPHLVSCCMIAYFVLKKIRCANRSWKFIFWSWKSHGKSLLKKSSHPVLYSCAWTVPSTVLDAVQEGAEGPMWHPIDHPFDCQITSPKKETKYHGMKSFIAYQITPSVSISLDYLTNWSWSLINHFTHLFVTTVL